MFENRLGRSVVGIAAAVGATSWLWLARRDAEWLFLMMPTLLLLPILAIAGCSRRDTSVLRVANAASYLLAPLGLVMGMLAPVLGTLNVFFAAVLIAAGNLWRDAAEKRLARIATAVGAIHFITAVLWGSSGATAISLALFVGGVVWIVEARHAAQTIG